MIELCSEYLSVRHIRLYVLVMSRSRFTVNPHSRVASIWRNSLLEGGAKFEVQVTATGLKPRISSLLNRHSAIWLNLRNNWVVFLVLICTVHLTVWFCHVTYALQSESTLYSWLNVEELLAQSRSKIWRWSNCNCTGTQDHLARKRRLTQFDQNEQIFQLCSEYLSVECISLYVLLMSRTRFRVNLHSIVKELLARSMREIWSLSDCIWSRTKNHLVCKWTVLEPRITWLVNEHSNISPI